MNRLELQISATAALGRERIECPRCHRRLDHFGMRDHYVCAAGHQFTAKQLVDWPDPPPTTGT